MIIGAAPKKQESLVLEAISRFALLRSQALRKSRTGDRNGSEVDQKDRTMPRLVADDIAAALKKRIDAGEWNRRIPPERELADEFGVARNTMRRAVGVLEANGTVVRQVGRGTFLAV